MEEDFSVGDVVSIALSSAATGDFLVAGGIGFAIQGWDFIAARPLAALGGVFSLAFIGLFAGVLIAAPVGLVVGLIMRQFFGSGRRVAFCSGVLTASLLFVIAYLDEGFGDPWLLGVGAAFRILGGALALVFYRHVTERAGQSPL